MSNKTILLEEYVNFVDSTKRQNTYFKIIIVLIVFCHIFAFLCVSLKYLIE